MEIKKATLNDLELVTQLRIEFLNLFESNKENPKNIKQYFKTHLANQSCLFLLAYEKEQIIGTGAIYFYDSIPSNSCPSGKIGHITSMWVDESCRSQKIAQKILIQLINEAKGKCDHIELSSSVAGEHLYTRFGFIKKEDVYIWNMH